MTPEQAQVLVQERFAVSVTAAGRALTATIPPERWRELGRFAREALGCVYFSFVSAVDWKDEGLEVVARVENVDANVALTMKTRLGPGVSECASLVPVYKGADWMERECFDMFGIRFDGHPDLRRILLPADWEGHPLLKSYAVDTPHPPYR